MNWYDRHERQVCLVQWQQQCSNVHYYTKGLGGGSREESVSQKEFMLCQVRWDYLLCIKFWGGTIFQYKFCIQILYANTIVPARIMNEMHCRLQHNSAGMWIMSVVCTAPRFLNTTSSDSTNWTELCIEITRRLGHKQEALLKLHKRLPQP